MKKLEQNRWYKYEDTSGLIGLIFTNNPDSSGYGLWRGAWQNRFYVNGDFELATIEEIQEHIEAYIRFKGFKGGATINREAINGFMSISDYAVIPCREKDEIAINVNTCCTTIHFNDLLVFYDGVWGKVAPSVVKNIDYKESEDIFECSIRDYLYVFEVDGDDSTYVGYMQKWSNGVVNMAITLPNKEIKKWDLSEVVFLKRYS